MDFRWVIRAVPVTLLPAICAVVVLGCSVEPKLSDPQQPKATPISTDKASTKSAGSAADAGSFSKVDETLPKPVGTLAALSIAPNVKVTAAPIAAELLNPTLPTLKTPMLRGEWVGLCFASGGANGTKCDRHRVFVNENRTCPADYIFKEFGIRTLADDSLWSSTCIYNATPSNDQLLNPTKYALAGALYGFCRYQKYVKDSPCEEALWPMKENRTCAEGFRFVATSGDGPRGSLNPTYLATGACALNENSTRPAPIFPGTLSSLCVHWHDRDDCVHGKFGPNIVDKKSCSAGFQVSHFTARWNNDNRYWASICIKN